MTAKMKLNTLPAARHPARLLRPPRFIHIHGYGGRIFINYLHSQKAAAPPSPWRCLASNLALPSNSSRQQFTPTVHANSSPAPTLHTTKHRTLLPMQTQSTCLVLQEAAQWADVS